ncbi:amino acid ABC transporter permease [Ectopseudomonas mendocina]|uniref:Amino acid ABC transporter permease n=1 Tax=Ectopseudomonas mendocina TaxID=300 RepID=A0ABZ2RLA9_ECTME
MNFDPSVVFQYWPALLKGLGFSLVLTFSCALIGMILGFFISLMRTSKNHLLYWSSTLFVEVFRGTPLLIQLFWIFFCLPIVFGTSFSPLVSVIISLVLFMGATSSESFRGALKSIPREQFDACQALGIGGVTRTTYIVFPQVLLRATPPLLSNSVALFKESALVSSVGIADLMFIGQNLSNRTARPVEFLTAVAIIYFVVAFPMTRIVGSIEARFLRRYAS